jgi:hypothetical protein
MKRRGYTIAISLNIPTQVVALLQQAFTVVHDSALQEIG